MSGTDIVIGLLGDCITYASSGAALTGTAGAAASTAIGRMMKKRHDVLREVIRSEIRQGSFDSVDQDELTSVFFRLIRDAQEGAAKNNLRLMAKVINGMAEKKELKAPTFLRYANILAGLSEQEITVLGIMAGLNWETFMGARGKEKFLEAGIENYQVVQQSLVRTGLVAMQIHSKAPKDIKHVVDIGNPSRFKIESEFVFTLTPLMSEILKYTDFPTKEAA